MTSFPAYEKYGPQAALASAALLASLGMSIANTALPAISSHLGASFSEVRWVVVAYLLSVTVSVAAAGRLGDLFGRRNFFLAGNLLFAAASLLCLLSPGLSALVAARALQGMGAAVSITLSQALAAELGGAGRAGRTIGLLGTVSAVGTALGPTLGGILVEAAGWRSVFLFLAVAGALAAALGARFLPRTFPQVEVHASQPGSSGGAPPIAASLLMNAAVSAVMMTTLVVGPFYLSQAQGLGPAEIGLVMSIGPALSILSGLPAGRLVDRLGARRVVPAGLLAMAAGAVGLVVLPPVFGVYGYALAIGFLSPGYQLFLAANGTAMITSAGAGRRGAVAGLLGLSRNLGLVAGSFGMGAVYASATGPAEGLRLTFLAAASLVAAALALSMVGAPAVGARARRPEKKALSKQGEFECKKAI